MEEYMVEGVSTNAILAITATLCGAFSLLLLISVYFRRIHPANQTIHPSSIGNVENVRTRIPRRRRRQEGDDNEELENQQRDEQCPICIDRLTLATETNCGHHFCGACIMAYWNHGTWMHCMKCPVCRQDVTIIFSNFTGEENQEEIGAVSVQINSYNRRFSGEPRTVMEYIADFPVLLRHLLRGLFSLDGMLLMFRLRIILLLSMAAFYVVSPLDLLPESLVGVLGFLDDIVIFIVILVYLTVIYRTYMAQQ